MQICTYIEELHNSDASKILIDEIEKSNFKKIIKFNSILTLFVCKEREGIYYRIYVRNYIIFYVVNDNIMEVRRIIYSKRDFEYLV